MAAGKGDIFRVYYANSSTPIAGDTEATVTLDGGLIEYQTKAGASVFREYDKSTMTISGSSMVDLTDNGLVAVNAAKVAGTKFTCEAVNTLGTYSASCLVESFEIQGNTGDMQTASYTMRSDGTITFTPAS